MRVGSDTVWWKGGQSKPQRWSWCPPTSKYECIPVLGSSTLPAMKSVLFDFLGSQQVRAGSCQQQIELSEFKLRHDPGLEFPFFPLSRAKSPP